MNKLNTTICTLLISMNFGCVHADPAKSAGAIANKQQTTPELESIKAEMVKGLDNAIENNPDQADKNIKKSQKLAKQRLQNKKETQAAQAKVQAAKPVTKPVAKVQAAKPVTKPVAKTQKVKAVVNHAAIKAAQEKKFAQMQASFQQGLKAKLNGNNGLAQKKFQQSNKKAAEYLNAK